MSKIAASPAGIVSVLFCQNRNWDDEFAVFLSEEAFARLGGIAIGVTRFQRDFQLLRRLEW
ncbi:MAG TPA: hypothetical protein VN957_18480 [Chthoniobacterales bacterium]|jgi:hypothetical protein|nr:hypothetical protein [Chthoniobacterales bacterium]